MAVKTIDLRRRQARLGWLFLLPTLLVLVAVGVYPLINTAATSFTDAYLASSRPTKFVGLRNYVRLYHEPEFWTAFFNTIVFTVSSVAIEFALGLGIALIINSQFKARGVVRAAMLIPWALPTVVSARIWNYMLVDTYGVVNDLLVTRLGFLPDKIAWLARPGFAMASIVAVDVWKTAPFVALLLLAGLQLIPGQLYEAAEVDGASRWQRFRYVTMPLLMPAAVVALIFRTLDALRVFDVIWVLTRGELGTQSLATYNYRQMVDFRKLGYGSAVSVSIFMLIGGFVIVYMIMSRKRQS